MRKLHNRSFGIAGAFDYYIPDFMGVLKLMIMFLIGFVVAEVVGVVLTFACGQDFLMTYGQTIMYALMFIPAIIYARRKSDANSLFESGRALDSRNFGKTGGFLAAVFAVVGIISLAFLCDPLTKLLPEMSDIWKQAMEKLTNGPLWITLLNVSIFAPLFEEWLLRGTVLRGLLQKTKPIWAIVISSALFALIHMNIWQALPAFIIGCLFGYVYFKTGSLKLTMLMHCVNNTISVVFSRIDAFEDADTFMDVIPSPAPYWIIFAAMAILLVLVLLRFKAIPLNEPTGNCDKVEPTTTEFATNQN